VDYQGTQRVHVAAYSRSILGNLSCRRVPQVIFGDLGVPDPARVDIRVDVLGGWGGQGTGGLRHWLTGRPPMSPRERCLHRCRKAPARVGLN